MLNPSFQSGMSKTGIQYKPQIFRQGLVLVLIPFAVGSCVLLLMSQVWFGAEKLVLAEEKQTELLFHFNAAFHQWSDAAGNLMARAFDEEARYYDNHADQYSNGLRSEFSQLRRLGETTNASSESLDKLEALCLNSIDEFSKLPRGMSSDPIANFRTLQQMPIIFRKAYVLPGQVRVPLENEWTRLQAVRKTENEQSRKTKLIAYLCVFGNIILSITLVWIFARGITKRLLIVTTNAGLLPKVQGLTEHVSGNDELAFLDAALHAASAKLNAAAEHRRTIFGMVAHDIRSPLLAAQLCLEVLGELMNSDYSDGTEDELNLAVAKIKNVLERVQFLLTVEKDSLEQNAENPLPEEVEQTPGLSRLPLLPRVLKFSNDMIFNQKIFHKVLWLVVIPIFVQSLFLIVVNQQIHNTEEIIVQERAQCNIVMNANRVFLDSLKATLGEAIYGISCEPKMKELVVRNYQGVISEFDRIMTFATNSPDWMTIMKTWRKLTARHLEDLNSQTEPVSGASMKDIIARFKKNRPLQRKAAAMSARAIVLFKKESVHIKELQDDQRESRKSVTDMLAWGIFANFLLALGMLASFSNDIKRRVILLVADAARLGDPKPLQENIVGGNDELGYLDLIFHQTKDQLIEAAQVRASLMNTLAQEMAGPLKEAQQSLNLFQEKEGNKLNDRKLKQLTRAQSNMNRVLDLINDLLTMETLETGMITLEPTTFDLRQMVLEAEATVSSLAAAKQINVINQCQEINIVADKSRLIQVVINFLSNAIKFSPDKSKITVTSMQEANYLRIDVTDEGPGMDDNTKSHVFDKFFQAEGPQKQLGFGLGLAICSMIIESHGGQIGVDSELGKGSTFWFELPNKLLRSTERLQNTRE